MTTAKQVRDQALQMPAKERAILARDLLISLEAVTSPEVFETDWVEEIEARADAYERGELPADDWRTSLERSRQRLRDTKNP